MPLLHGELTNKIIEAFYEVAFEMGTGWPESVYAAAMEIALQEKGLDVRREVPLKVYFRGRVVKIYRADTLVESRVILEYKSGSRAIEAAEAQLMNYLRCTPIEVGLLLNFAVKPVSNGSFLRTTGKPPSVGVRWIPSFPVFNDGPSIEPRPKRALN